MQRVPLECPTQVLRCGGVSAYQLLCGREIARGSTHAFQSANYCYLIVNTHDRTAIAVDAAWDVEGMYALAERLGVRIKGAIYSHFHFDHCGGDTGMLAAMAGRQVLPGAKEVEERGGQIWAGKDDAAQIKKQCSLESISALDDGDVLDCGDLVLHALHTPGHSPGSICIYAAPRCLSPRGALSQSALQEELVAADAGMLLTGDTLFVGACGRTDMPQAGMDPRLMAKSLSRLSTMNPAVLVLPGHNYAPVPYTTIGAERAHNESVKYGLLSFPAPPPLPPCVACDGRGNCGPRGFVIGRKVRIKGLESEAGRALNGQDAVLEGFSTQKGRYMVRLLSASETKVLKPGNVEQGRPSEGAPAESEGAVPDARGGAGGVAGTAVPEAPPSAPRNEDAAVASLFDGVISVETTDTMARPWRLRHGDRALYGEALAAMAACAAVRIVLGSEGSSLRVVASTAPPSGVDEAALQRAGAYPLEYELYVNGDFFALRRQEAKEGKHTIVFDGLPDGPKEMELWLPVATPLAVHAVDCGAARVERPPGLDARPVWLCYGSSITHGGTAQATPSGTWPATCSRLAGLRLINLGFAGECFLDQSVARTIRDTPCDCITLKVGINIHCMGALTARTLPPAIFGFIRTVRDGHPTTPLLVVSSIWYGPGEAKAPIGAPQFLTMAQFREALKAAVAALRAIGDEHLFYRDGLELLGKDDAALLYDGIHPGPEGHFLMGHRFAGLEFGPGGRLLPGRLSAEAAEKALAVTPNSDSCPRVLLKDLLGPYYCLVPGEQPCRVVIKKVEGDLMAISDRKDWPPSALAARADLVFLRSSPGTWGRVEGSKITFSNGISWVKAPAQAPPAAPRE